MTGARMPDMLCWVGLVGLALAQAAPLANAAEVEVYGPGAGLPATARAAVETRDGKIWFATDAGIAGFDGTRFAVTTTEQEPKLRSDQVLALGPSPDGYLTVGTALGLTT